MSFIRGRDFDSACANVGRLLSKDTDLSSDGKGSLGHFIYKTSETIDEAKLTLETTTKLLRGMTKTTFQLVTGGAIQAGTAAADYWNSAGETERLDRIEQALERTAQAEEAKANLKHASGESPPSLFRAVSLISLVGSNHICGVTADFFSTQVLDMVNRAAELHGDDCLLVFHHSNDYHGALYRQLRLDRQRPLAERHFPHVADLGLHDNWLIMVTSIIAMETEARKLGRTIRIRILFPADNAYTLVQPASFPDDFGTSVHLVGQKGRTGFPMVTLGDFRFNGNNALHQTGRLTDIYVQTVSKEKQIMSVVFASILSPVETMCGAVTAALPFMAFASLTPAAPVAWAGYASLCVGGAVGGLLGWQAGGEAGSYTKTTKTQC